jgi:hypothetical protein
MSRCSLQFRIIGIENVTIENTSAGEYLSRNPQADYHLHSHREESPGRKTLRIEDCPPHVSELKPMHASLSPHPD